MLVPEKSTPAPAFVLEEIGPEAEILLRLEDSGLATAILPGSLPIVMSDGSVDISPEWRYASWYRFDHEAEVVDQPANYITPASLPQLIKENPEYTRWMISKTATQLEELIDHSKAKRYHEKINQLAMLQTVYHVGFELSDGYQAGYPELPESVARMARMALIRFHKFSALT
jgi:hypothetical protein